MTAASNAAAHADVERALSLGTGRAPAPPTDVIETLGGTERWARSAAAFSSLRRPFAVGAVPAFEPDAPPPWIDAPVATAPVREALRALQRRGLLKTTFLPQTAHAVWRELTRAGIGLHPFDWEPLEPLTLHGPENTPARLHALARGGEAQLGHDLDEDEWATAPVPLRLALLKKLRGEDPAKGRALLEASFTHETAAVRLRLVDGLATGLSAGDVPFLRSLDADRSSKVKDRAIALLQRIPGTDEAMGAAEARLDNAAASIVERAVKGKVKKLLGKGPGLDLDMPVAAKARADVRFAAIKRFDGVGITGLGAALGIAPDQLVKRSSDSEALQTGLLMALTSTGDNLKDAKRMSLAKGLGSASWETVLQIVASDPKGHERTLTPFDAVPRDALESGLHAGMILGLAQASGGELAPAIIRAIKPLLRGEDGPRLDQGDQSTALVALAAALPSNEARSILEPVMRAHPHIAPLTLHTLLDTIDALRAARP